MKAIARRMGNEDEFEGLIISCQSILPPKGASEIEVKTQQVCRSYFELGLKICFMALTCKATDILKWWFLVFGFCFLWGFFAF